MNGTRVLTGALHLQRTRVGDYTVLTINDAARARADAWDAAINTLPEHQTVFAPAAWPLFYGALVAVAFAEEHAWDRLVWHDHGDLFLGPSLRLPGSALDTLQPVNEADKGGLFFSFERKEVPLGRAVMGSAKLKVNVRAEAIR